MHKNGNLRLEVEHDLSEREEAEVFQTIRGHDYQTVTIKKHGGDIVRLTQTVLVTMPEVRNGKNPNGPAKSRRK